MRKLVLTAILGLAANLAWAESDVAFLLEKGRFYANHDTPSMAVELFEQVLQLDPGNVEAEEWLERLAKQGELSARKHLKGKSKDSGKIQPGESEALTLAKVEASEARREAAEARKAAEEAKQDAAAVREELEALKADLKAGKAQVPGGHAEARPLNAPPTKRGLFDPEQVKVKRGLGSLILFAVLGLIWFLTIVIILFKTLTKKKPANLAPQPEAAA